MGSIPELKAINRSKRPVLMLDEEEIIGAKQNCVFNTTIMIGPESSLIIAVSCVERGRWEGRSLCLDKSENIMIFSTRAIKTIKTKSVDYSLERERKIRFDQMAIWQDLAKRQKNSEFFSPI